MKKFVPAVLIALLGSIQAKDSPDLKSSLERIAQLGRDHLGYLEAVSDVYPEWSRSDRRFSRTVDYFDLFTGQLAIRESLQFETIGKSEGGSGIAISTLPKVNVASHDFVKMMQGRSFKAFPLASASPEDFYYVHVASLTKALDLFEKFAEQGSALYRQISRQAVDYRIRDKIMTQLALQQNPIARKFYDSIIEEMVITGSDFFVQSGSDISLIFRIRQPDLFRATLKSYRADALKAGAREESVKIGGKSASRVFTPLGEVNSYLVEAEDGMFILSNSDSALEVILKTVAKKYRSQNDLADFRYMRSVYPADRSTEDVFVYLSDPFIRHLISAPLRIKEARRAAVAHKISLFEKFILLYRHKNRKNPQNRNQILELMKVPEKEKSFLNDIDIVPGKLFAIHKKFGRIGFMKPDIEETISNVSPKEAAGYGEFVRRYNDFWREYFDPIGIRIRSGESSQVELCILPLINNSIYNGLTAVIGGTPGPVATATVPGEIFSAAFRVNAPFIDKEFKGEFSELTGGSVKRLSDLFEGDVQLHMRDTEPSVDFNGQMLANELFRGFRFNDAFAGVAIWSLFHPLRLSLKLKDIKEADRLLGMLHQLVQGKSGSGWLRERRVVYSMKMESAADSQTVQVIQLEFFDSLTYRFFITRKGDYLHITTTADYMESVLKNYPEKPETTRANALLSFRPSNIMKERSMFLAGQGEKLTDLSLGNLATVQLMHEIFPGGNYNEILWENYNFTVISPDGGDYQIEKGTAMSPVFGTPGNRTVDAATVKRLNGEYLSLKRLSVNFRFTPEGIMTEFAAE